jgi:DNA modification methylase
MVYNIRRLVINNINEDMQLLSHWNYWGSLVWVRRNRSTTGQTFRNRQTLEKKWEYNGTVHQLFVDCKKAHDSVQNSDRVWGTHEAS